MTRIFRRLTTQETFVVHFALWDREDEKSMYCNYCGKVLPDDALLCAYCGKRVAGVVARQRLVYSLSEMSLFDA